MNILFVTPVPPVPTTGSRTRLYNLVKQLSKRHQISLLSFAQPGDDAATLAIAGSCFRAVEFVPLEPFPKLGRWENRWRGWKQILFNARPRYGLLFPTDDLRGPLREMLCAYDFDAVVLQSLYVAALCDQIHDVPALLATENVESDIARKNLANAGNPIHRLRDGLELRKLQDYERDMVRCFQIVIAVSEPDMVALREMAPQSEVFLVCNGVDTKAFLPPATRREDHEILFFGTLSYGPNADGIVWFCHYIFPLVMAQIPDAKLVIVGKDAPERVQALAALPGVELVGFVPDIRDRLWNATLSIAPLLSGGGTRLKILEALAAKCPVVTTTVGAEGLEVRNGKHLVIADTPEEFSQGVVKLLQDAELRMRLAENGQKLVEQSYDWAPISMNLEQACERAVQLFKAGQSGPPTD